MADNAPTTPADAKGGTVSPLDLAIGLSILDALGDGGEVVGRRNSPFFNNSFDAFGLPRNRFSLMQNILPRQDESPLWGQDIRTILGGHAEVYSSSGYGNNNSNFAMGVMGMLFGGGIFATLMGGVNSGISQEMRVLQQIASGDTASLEAPPAPARNTPAAATGPAIGPAAATGSATGGRVSDQLGTIRVEGEDGEAPAVVAAASTARTTASTARTAPTAASAEPAAAAGRVVDIPVDRAVPASIVCEVPKPEAETKKCVLPAKPPRM